jgi:hypothetical protein
MNTDTFNLQLRQCTGEDARAYIWQSGIIPHE